MIIIDTNVLSALMLREPDETVVAWLDSLPPESIWTTSVTVFEIRFGLELLDNGRKKQRLMDAFELALTEDLCGRVLDFDKLAAREAAVFCSEQRKLGRALEIRDAMICGIARARRASVATRNVRHFEGAEVTIINPWS